MSGLSLTKAVTIALANQRRMFRDRGNLFFVFLLPTLIIVVLGLSFGGAGEVRLGVVAPEGDPAAEALVTQIGRDSPVFVVRPYPDEPSLRTAVERGSVEAGVVIPEDYAARLAGAETVEVGYLGTPETATAGYRTTVEAAVAEQAALVTAARTAAQLGAGAYDEAFATAVDLAPTVSGISVDVSRVGEEFMFEGYGQFTFGAQTQLVMFMFLTSLTAAAQVVQTRSFGVSRRMVSTPTSIATIVAGETLGRYAIAIMQGLFVVLLTAVAFGVSWGDPLAAAAIILSFGLVGAGVAMLIGALSRNVEQAGSLGVFGGLALGALGGCMVPLAFMPDAMYAFAHAIPHFWALTGFQALINQSGGLDLVAGNVLVLLAYGLVVLALAVWRFRAAITG